MIIWRPVPVSVGVSLPGWNALSIAHVKSCQSKAGSKGQACNFLLTEPLAALTCLVLGSPVRHLSHISTSTFSQHCLHHILELARADTIRTGIHFNWASFPGRGNSVYWWSLLPGNLVPWRYEVARNSAIIHSNHADTGFYISFRSQLTHSHPATSPSP